VWIIGIGMGLYTDVRGVGTSNTDQVSHATNSRVESINNSLEIDFQVAGAARGSIIHAHEFMSLRTVVHLNSNCTTFDTH
jgi:hypothetical protein